MKRLFPVVLLALAWVAGACAQQSFQLKDGDRVVFYGDSITEQRLYTTFAETYVVTRFPKLKVSFVHSGWGGDRVTGGGGGPIDLRVKRDILAYKPTMVTVMLGMNDGEYRAFDQKVFDTYANGLKHIVEAVKSALPAVRFVLIQPSPFDDVTHPPQFPGGYNAVLVRYGQFIAELAKTQGLTAADLNTPVVAALRKANATDAKTAQQIIPDRVHPDAGGHLLMAEALLKAWDAPAVVSSVEIDGAGARVESADNAEVSAVAAAEGGLTWTQKDAALPMPLDPQDRVLQLSVRSSDFLDAMDRQPLKVTGLTAARYALAIDGERVGVFTRAQLAEGVNLASLPTPMAAQAQRVHDLTIKHNDVHSARWREVQVPLDGFYLRSAQPAIDSLDKLEAELIVRQHAAAQPQAHRFQLAPER
jgi:lysophospholipase L1-like esterase